MVYKCRDHTYGENDGGGSGGGDGGGDSKMMGVMIVMITMMTTMVLWLLVLHKLQMLLICSASRLSQVHQTTTESF